MDRSGPEAALRPRPAGARTRSALAAFRLRLLATLATLSLSACLFDTETPFPPSSDFAAELSHLARARNPLLSALGLPQGGSLVGLQFAFTSTDYARQTDSNVEVFHTQTGVYPALAGAYFDFTTKPNNLVIFLRAAHAKGCVPSVTLDPKDYAHPDLTYQKTFLGLTAAGGFDSALAGWAAALRDFGGPVVLRFAHEMNGDWYPYGGGGDADGDGRPDGPEAFIRAWRHAHDVFAAQGASNVLWAFCPNAENFPDRSWNRPFRYYPGDGYADLVFVDAYEHQNKRTQSLPQALDLFLAELGEFLRQRPATGDSLLPAFGLGEFGTNRTDPAAKADWYRQSLLYLGSEDRIQFHFLYNGQDGDGKNAQDFSLRGLEGRLDSAYMQSAFRYRLLAPG